jgi:predicted GNAT family N-acyltransferase
MGTPFINLLTPSAHMLDGYRKGEPPTPETQPSNIPRTFLDAMTVRKQVFVEEQNIPIEFEFDEDDARSCHWVIYSSIHRTVQPELRNEATGEIIRRKQSETKTVPIGTIRLVPFPHPPHPAVGGVYVDGKLVATEASLSVESGEAGGKVDHDVAEALVENEQRRISYISPYGADRATSFHDGREAYVKLGRLAVVKELRGHGLARLLVRAALDWIRTHPAYFNPSVANLGFAQLGIEEASDIPKWNGLVCCHAQEQVAQAWQKLGFKVDEEMGRWKEEGIWHVGMFQRLDVSGGHKA